MKWIILLLLCILFYHCKHIEEIVCDLPSFFSSSCMTIRQMISELELKNKDTGAPLYIQMDDDLVRSYSEEWLKK